MTRPAGESGSPTSRVSPVVPVGLALALPVLLSVTLLLVARQFLVAAAVALAGLLLLAWARAALGRMTAEARGAGRALAEKKRALAAREEEVGAIRARLQEAERMAAVAGLAGSVAHDFNNLLTGIQGYARLLLDRVGPGDPIRRQLAAIVNAAARAADLASQLQAIDARVDSPAARPAATDLSAAPISTIPSATGASTSAPGPMAGTPPAQKVPAPATSGPRCTILAVDDESSILALAKDVLELEGYRVLVARNGEEALRVYRESQGSIDLVLLDLTMPVMGGVECFKRLRALDPAVRVVISSGFTSESATHDLMHDGALDCLQKPWEIQALARTVAAALAREPARTGSRAASG
jgi:CheY-like chemotaxis protein